MPDPAGPKPHYRGRKKVTGAERRHVVATGVERIGKEANQVGESGEVDPIRSAVQEFSSQIPAAGERQCAKKSVRTTTRSSR